MTQPDATIRTNLITGFLGAGKTTAINALIRQRPFGHRWAVFVNEYGMVPVDQALFEGQDSEVDVEELGGGCMCCSTAFLVPPILARLIRKARPHRLLIEPTGVGHPASLIDQLRGEHFGHLLDLGPTLCIVDPKDFENPRLRSSPMFFDQIQMADIVAINWTDERDPESVRRCSDWIERFDPPKLLVLETRHGHVPLECLDLEGTVIRPPRFGDAHDRARAEADRSPGTRADPSDRETLDPPEAPGRPLRLENADGSQSACGWIFHHDDRFDREALLDPLDEVGPILRLKGVVRFRDDWYAIHRKRAESSVEPSAYRRDSRLELIIEGEAPDWSALEGRLLSCLLK